MSKILIVEDDASMREWLARLLASRSHDTLEAANGCEALEIARQQRPNLVLSDVLMPVMDGFKLLRQLRLDPATASIPVILISGVYDSDAARALAAVGCAFALVRKPFREEQLFQHIDAALAVGRRAAVTLAVPSEFGRDHMRLLMDKVSEKAAQAEQAGERLRKSDALLSEAQALAHIRSWEWKISSDTVICSDEKCPIMGLEPEEVPVTYATFRNCLHPDDRTRIDEAIQQAYRDHQPFRCEYRAILPDGRVQFQHVEGTVVTDKNGRPVRILGTTQDITERKLAEEALRESEQRFRHLIKTLPAAVYICDSEGRITFYNDIAATIWGREPRIGEDVWCGARKLYHSDGSPLAHEDCPMAIAIREGRAIRGVEIVVERPDGTRSYVLPHPDPIRDASGAIVGAVNMMVDLTERKVAADALRESETRFRQLAENISEIFWLTNPEGTLMHYVSPTYEKIWGRPCDSLYAAPKSWMDAIHPDDCEGIAEAKRSQEICGGYDHTYRIIRSDGSIRWIRDRAFPVCDDSGKLIRVAGIAEDITERKDAERQIEHFAELFRALSHRLLHAQEEERRHLARELHDEIIQTLTAAKLNLKIIAPEVFPAVAERLEDSIRLLDCLLMQVRQLSLDLRPPLLDELGLVPALRWLADQQAQRARLRITFTATGENIEMDPPIRTACFRVAQEAITNAIRHAQASTVAVELRAEPDGVWLAVHDDGVGFDNEAMQQRAGRGASIGLLSMNERVSLLGGELEVCSAPRQGTEIRAWFPLAPPGPDVTTYTHEHTSRRPGR